MYWMPRPSTSSKKHSTSNPWDRAATTTMYLSDTNIDTAGARRLAQAADQ